MPEGGYALIEEAKRAAEVKKKEDALRKAGFEVFMAGKGTEKWVHVDKGLSAGGPGTPGTPEKAIKYGMGYDEHHKLPDAGKWAKPTPTTPTLPVIRPPTSSPSSSGSTSAPARAPAPPPPPTTPISESGPLAPSSGEDSVVKTTQPMDMATLTDDMDLSNKLKEIIDMNTPLFKSAQTKAMQAMQARGILNSSLANEAVMNSILNVALPIAQSEVQALQQNLYYNTDWTNKDKQMANDYVYNRMLTKLQGAINMQLQEMVQSYAAWGKYGDWISNIITQEGADQDAWKRMLNAMTGAGGWPQIPS